MAYCWTRAVFWEWEITQFGNGDQCYFLCCWSFFLVKNYLSTFLCGLEHECSTVPSSLNLHYRSWKQLLLVPLRLCHHYKVGSRHCAQSVRLQDFEPWTHKTRRCGVLEAAVRVRGSLVPSNFLSLVLISSILWAFHILLMYTLSA